ncbi:MAG: cytochrome c [Planctomycetaceae bacterium]
MRTVLAGKLCSIVLLVAIAVLAALGTGAWSNATSAAVAQPAGGAAAPVEDDLHEFMEYVFEPTFERLKAAMAAKEKDDAKWKAVKSDALILAEGGNLLLIRKPDEDAADWTKHAVAARDAGGELYRAAKAKDANAAGTRYRAMIARCNACHEQFSAGEPMLEP